MLTSASIIWVYSDILLSVLFDALRLAGDEDPELAVAPLLPRGQNIRQEKRETCRTTRPSASRRFRPDRRENTAVLTSVIEQPPDVDRPFVLFLLELTAGLHQTLVDLGQIRCLRKIRRNWGRQKALRWCCLVSMSFNATKLMWVCIIDAEVNHLIAILNRVASELTLCLSELNSLSKPCFKGF